MLSYKEFMELRESSSVEARELYLYIINDEELYKNRAQAIIKNLRKKFLKGDYDQEKAYKAWSYLAEDGAKKYHKEFGSNGTWSAMFPKAVRDEVAKELEYSFKEEVEEAEMADKKENNSTVNEDVVGMVANNSIQMLLGLPEFQDFKDDNLFWSMSRERVPVFGYVKNGVQTITTVEIPLFRNQSELIKFPKESRVGLAKQLKMAIN